jgi:hypothetical protein
MASKVKQEVKQEDEQAPPHHAMASTSNVKQEVKLEVKQEPDPMVLTQAEVAEQELREGDDDGSVTDFPDAEHAAVRS